MSNSPESTEFELNRQYTKLPNIDDTDFAKKIGAIYNQFKIRSKKQSLKEICYPSKFTYQKPQLFVGQYINPRTPYKSLLVYHKIGAGKTCAGVSICEKWKNKKNIVVVVPASLVGNFYKELRSECAGEDYMTNKERKRVVELNPDNAEYIRILAGVKKRIDKYYTILSYHKFVSLAQEKKINLKNSLLLIDEVQNIVSEGGTFYNTFMKAIYSAPKDIRVVLLSATPIFDRPNELGLTLNLLRPRIEFPIGSEFNDMFIKIIKNKEGETKYELKNTNKLKSMMNSYISYYKGAPDHVFPKKSLKLVKCKMSKYQYDAYRTTMEQTGYGRFNDSDILDLPNDFLIGPRMISNVAFPNKGINEEGFDSFKGRSLSFENLKTFSIKFYKIMRKIRSCKGTVFVYSSFKEYGGIKSFIKVLEYFNYKNFKKNGSGKMRYAIWSGDESSESKELIKDFFNKKENADGSLIKVLLGSPSIKEGISLLRVKQVHIMEPYWNMSRLEQVIGRAIRFCSHKDVPLNERKVEVYIYIAVGNQNDEDTVDQHIMELAFKKKELTDLFEGVMKDTAIDKYLFQNK